MNRFVLLHGFTGSPASWDAVLGHLPTNAAVLAPALAGHGGPPAATFDGEVDRLAALVRAAGFGGSVLAGYSLGARLALGLLVRHPGLASSAALLGVHPGLEDEGDRARRLADEERWARLLEEEGLERFVERWAAQPLFGSQGAIPGAALESQRRIRLSHDPRRLAAALRALGRAAMPCQLDRLGEVQVPVRVVAGERDAKFAGLAREVAGRLPCAGVRIVPGAGHNVILEAPRAVAALLMELTPCPD